MGNGLRVFVRFEGGLSFGIRFKVLVEVLGLGLDLGIRFGI